MIGRLLVSSYHSYTLNYERRETEERGKRDKVFMESRPHVTYLCGCLNEYATYRCACIITPKITSNIEQYKL